MHIQGLSSAHASAKSKRNDLNTTIKSGVTSNKLNSSSSRSKGGYTFLSRRKLQGKLSRSKDPPRRQSTVAKKDYIAQLQEVKFDELTSQTGMTRDKKLGILIRDDYLIRMLARDKNEIYELWKAQCA